MARPLRIHLPEAIYHVLNRGNNQQDIFLEEKDYQHYLQILKRYKDKFGFKFFAYCLMPNHVHLLLQTSGKSTISQIMQGVTIAHTRYYHYIRKTSGHIWQGRFKSPLVSDDEYLLTVMRYIEQNPIRAGLVKNLEQYPWSSFFANTSPLTDSIIDREQNPVFLNLGKDIEERCKNYRRWVVSSLEDNQLKEIQGSLNGQRQYISSQFHEHIEERLRLIKKILRGRPRKIKL